MQLAAKIQENLIFMKTSSLITTPSECFMLNFFFLIQSYWMLNLKRGLLHVIRNNFASVIFIFTKLGRDMLDR